ncbi:hypothetical protein Clacol_004279 [Clathrus columnatus]|uniref:Thc1 RRM domain-containing protein n=1 Tax=Clathrus columnatus TaxID=1419009 RepID=A0AAV5A9B2_9AGAM|nr:hypothetical protein Clacol_004279 [Clathrus columnatus]
MASQLAPLSASVTRILYLSGFPSELKTRDIQAAFSDWENVNGGFKIKWKDDTSLLIVFADASTAKRAYLQTLALPPAAFSSPTSSKTATIKPYDGSDAQSIIQAVNARTHTHNGSRGHGHRSSVSINGLPNTRRAQLTMSTSLGPSAGMPDGSPMTATPNSAFMTPLNTIARDHSPTLPNVPAHPTLSSLINLSLPINTDSGDGFNPSQPTAVPTDPSGGSPPAHENQGTPPRIGDPGRRMVGHALGIRHPSLSSHRSLSSGGAGTVEQAQQSLASLTVED